MTLQSQLVLDQKAFDPAAIPAETNAFNQKLMDMMSGAPRWYEVGAEKYRIMRATGKTPLPAEVLLDSASTSSIPSRDAGRTIPTRIFKPTNNKSITGVFMHIHGGGWVLQSESSQDPMLQLISNNTGLITISIGYRLAPEEPFPAGPNDCYDAASWLVQNSESSYGAALSFIGGESAGGHLSMLTGLYLLEEHPDFALRGLLLHFGAYSQSWTPQVYNYQKPETLVLNDTIMQHYREAFIPGADAQRLMQPDISPLYKDLYKLRGRLPPALFTCGTEDPLLDDTVFMSAKWLMAGAEAVVRIVPGGCHGYIFFVNAPESGSPQGIDATTEFVKSKVG